MTERIEEVDTYLNKLDPERRLALAKIRSLILESAPDVLESMKYRMPTYELDGVVCAFSSQKHYMSLYIDTSPIQKHRQEFGDLSVG